jgi:hypothetical protein
MRQDSRPDVDVCQSCQPVPHDWQTFLTGNVAWKVSGQRYEGKIPFRLVGSHRRVRVADLIEYKQKNEAHRKAVLDELTAEAEKHGLGY